MNIVSFNFKKAAYGAVILLVGFYMLKLMNPFGIFNSEATKKYLRVEKTANEISSLIASKVAAKTSNDSRIKELSSEKDSKLNTIKENEAAICGVSKQKGKEDVDFSATCSVSEVSEFKKSFSGSTSK